jgi:hypothetical protein
VAAQHRLRHVGGTARVRAVEIGGDVNARLTTDWEWPLTGTPTLTPLEEAGP